VPAKQRGEGIHHDDVATGRGSLQAHPLTLADELVADSEMPCLEINVLPGEAERLGDAKACEEAHGD
jgi:hypothetical protein